MYEDLPFPPRNPSDERKPDGKLRQPIHSSLASLTEIAHFSFKGRFKQRFCGKDRKAFRALVLGGGTGDATVQLAQELARLHSKSPSCFYNRSVVIQLDLSSSATQITYKRLRERRLSVVIGSGSVAEQQTKKAKKKASGSPVIRLLVGSIESLASALQSIGQTQTFDYVNLCGVLHHTPYPVNTLRIIAKHALAPTGSIGMMVYGTYGRSGVYETQSMLKILHSKSNVSSRAVRASDAFDLVKALPPDAILRRNDAVWSSDEVRGRMGDAGIADLLLNPIDKPYTHSRLIEDARLADLKPTGWLQRALYEPNHWIGKCNRVFARCDAAPVLPMLNDAILSLKKKAAFTERFTGHVRKHWVYLTHAVPRGDKHLPAGTASGTEKDLAPCVLNMSDTTRQLLTARAGKRFKVSTSVQGLDLVSDMPAVTSDALNVIDGCKKTLQTVGDVVGGWGVGGDVGYFFTMDQWTELYKALAGVGYLFMGDHLMEEYRSGQTTVG